MSGRREETLYMRHGRPTAGDIDAVARLGTTLIGNRHPTGERLRERIATDPACLLVVRRSPAGSSAIVAYSSIYALGPAATAAVLDGRLPGSAGIRPADLVPDGATSLYVGMVAAADAMARVIAVRAAATHLLRRLAALPGVTRLFARPATPHGVRLLRGLGFTALDAPATQQVPPVWARLVGRDLGAGMASTRLVSRRDAALLASRLRRG